MAGKLLLETERLILRAFSREDADHLFELDSDPDVMRFLSGGTPTPREIIDTEILPLFLSYDAGKSGFGFWAAIEKPANEFVGWFSLRPLEGSGGAEVSLGFRLRRAVWGQGYATEGSLALIRLAFDELGVSRIVACTYQDNDASRRVLEKVGMTLNRIFRLTPEDLNDVDTYHLLDQEVWDGDDLEYSLHRIDYERQARN